MRKGVSSYNNTLTQAYDAVVSSGERLLGIVIMLRTLLLEWTGWGLEVIGLTMLIALLLWAVNKWVVQPRLQQKRYRQRYGGIGHNPGHTTRKKQE